MAYIFAATVTSTTHAQNVPSSWTLACQSHDMNLSDSAGTLFSSPVISICLKRSERHTCLYKHPTKKGFLLG